MCRTLERGTSGRWRDQRSLPGSRPKALLVKIRRAGSRQPAASICGRRECLLRKVAADYLAPFPEEDDGCARQTPGHWQPSLAAVAQVPQERASRKSLDHHGSKLRRDSRTAPLVITE